jgi:hypothetical protein
MTAATSNYVTLIRSHNPSVLCKRYTKVDGKLKKKAVAHVTSGTAVTTEVPNLRALAAVLETVTNSTDMCLVPGYFHKSDPSTPFALVTEKELSRQTLLSEGDMEGGIHIINGQPIAARLRRGIDPSSCLLLDADNPPGIPPEWAAMDISQRLKLFANLVPRIDRCERLELRGSSARVVNGAGPGPKTHAWLTVNDPSRIEILRAQVQIDMVRKGLYFMSPRFSKATGDVIGYEARTLFDLSVWVPGRIVFNAKPELGAGMEDYSIAPADITIVNEGRGSLDISFAEIPRDQALAEYKEKTGHEVRVRSDNGSVSTVDMTQLQLDTPITRRGETKPLSDWLDGMKPGDRLRCESPFRDSSSEAAFIRKRDDGSVIVYDIGNSTTYQLELGPAADFDPITGETVHPLARFVEWDLKPKAVRWVIPGFIGHGVTLIAGAQGVGKTTTMLPLAMVAAGIHASSDQLAPRHWRHVVYIVEDVEQAQRIVSGLVHYSGLGISENLVNERLHIVEAKRLKPTLVAQVGALYCERFTRNVDGVDIQPLVVLDTKSAVLALENENDNSEGSAAMAALKQGFERLPVWLIGHVAKQNIGRSDLAGLSARGASAFEADANQVLYLVSDADKRYLVRGKTRFEANWPELQIDSFWASTMAVDEFGEIESVTMRWNTAAPALQSRKEAVAIAKEAEKKEDLEDLRDEVRTAIEVAWMLGNPLNREGVKAKLRRKKDTVATTIESLLSELWLYEVPVPLKLRTNPKRSSFLVSLTTTEHEAFVGSGVPPPEKLEIPQAWRKPEIPSDSERSCTDGISVKGERVPDVPNT